MFLVDTLFAGQDLTMSLKIQLAQIYGKGRDNLQIIAPFVKSQVGGNDCGAFAIANLVEFCMGNFWRDKDSLSSRSDLCQDTLRSHLVTCFEKQKFSEFMARSSYGRKSHKNYSIDTNCRCGLPNEYDDNMVLCNGCGGGFIMCVLELVSLLCLMCGCVLNVNRWVMTSSGDHHGMYEIRQSLWSLFGCLCVCVRFHGFESWLLKDLTTVDKLICIRCIYNVFCFS